MSDNAQRLRTACAARLAPLLLVLALPTLAQDQFMYRINPDLTITITKYLGSGGALAIPATLDGLTVAVIGEDAFYGATSLTALTIPNTVTGIETNAFDYCTGLISLTIGDSVTDIEDGAFASCSSLTNLTLPSSVTTIGDAAFFSCSSLTAIYFKGNAPAVIPGAFGNDNAATVYYLPGTTGWGPTFDGLPAVLLNSPVQISIANVGVRTNQFGFTITGTSNIVAVVEASTNLANPTWSPLQTNTLTTGSAYFSDPQWRNYPSRFYRLRSP